MLKPLPAHRIGLWLGAGLQTAAAALGGLVLLATAGVASAGLSAYTVNGVDLVYDDDLDLTWLQDANLFLTQYQADSSILGDILVEVPTVYHAGGTQNLTTTDFDTSNGHMSWYGAMAWSEWLGSINYGGADDWRLWSALNTDGSGPCAGPNCNDSEMGDLFHGEGGRPLGALSLFSGGITGSAILTGLFSNMSSSVYWSGTESAPPYTDRAWIFDAFPGYQNVESKNIWHQAWAVRPGQVVAAPPGVVPLPGTLWLFAAGLLGLSLGRRRWVIRRFE